jgi:UDP-GlcNAc:undecaprenyl-phosphate/decaprenyl-phosphate GlcNAc-1-phosphate transferase
MQYVVPFIVAMVLAMAWLPLLAKFAARWGIVDHPDVRKVHAAPIPRIGGLAMALAVLVAALIGIDLQPQDRWFLIAAGVLVAFGALDDRFNLDYRIKFVGQLAAVGIVVLLGDVQVQAMTLDDRVLLPGWISLPLTIFFLVGITNAVNLADGLDGLAGGTTFLCLCAVALLSSVGDHNAGTALCLAFAGAILGFLRFNTYPATVFMGDAGSQLLGFTIGVSSIRATQSLATQVSAAIPILLLAIPILDTLSVMVQRVGEGRSPFSPDKNHIHHKLLALGFGHHEAVMLIYTVQAALFIAAYYLRYESDLTILAFVTTFFVLSITAMQVAARSGWRLHRADAAAESPLSRMATVLQQPSWLPRYSYLAIVTALIVYDGIIVLRTAALSDDIRVLIMVLFVLAVVLLLILRAGALNPLEKATLYVAATVLVYLDGLVLPPPTHLISILTWSAVSVAGVATAVRLRLHRDRRFQVTPLDLIVLFMALVVPSLTRTFNLPHDGALTIAKLVILFYAVEVLLGRVERRALWLRLAVVSTLAALALRSSMPF